MGYLIIIHQIGSISWNVTNDRHSKKTIEYRNMREYYVYILTNKKNTTLYVGVTNDLERRIFEHKNRVHNGFSSKYKLTKLVYFEETDDISAALHREKQLKKWRRIWKEDLIREMNPQWVDLSISWFPTENGDPGSSPG